MRWPVFNEKVQLGIVVRVLKLDEYAPRQPRRPDELQQGLFEGVRVRLELLDERRFGNGMVYLHYRTKA